MLRCPIVLPAIIWSRFVRDTVLFNCQRFEPRSHFISRLSMIVWVNAVLIRLLLLTVPDVLTTYVVVI